jgi:hypothetical protein
MFVVDLMHEFELGVWKALFIHLLRMLEAYDKNALYELDRRYARPARGSSHMATESTCSQV